MQRANPLLSPQSVVTNLVGIVILCLVLVGCGAPETPDGPPAAEPAVSLPDATATAAAQVIAQALDTAGGAPGRTPTATPSALPATATSNVALASPTPNGAASATTMAAQIAKALQETLTAMPTTTPTGTATQTPTETPDAVATAAALETRVAERVAATLAAAPPTPAPQPQAAAVTLAATSTPVVVGCAIATAPELSGLWSQHDLGCPLNQGHLSWSSWTPYERGFMLWRDDTRSIYGFFGSGWWQSTPDVWDGQSPTPSRGAPPPGLLEPERGTGHIWGTNDTFFNELGWARDKQKGFCAFVQDFEYGFLLRSSQVEFCKDALYNHAREGDFPLNSLRSYSGGGWLLNQ